jgi:hypothetical protein
MQLNGTEHLLLYSLAFVAMVTLWRFWPSHWKIRHVLAISVMLRVAMMPFAASDDVNRYIWEGTIQNHGYNPYSASPDDPVLTPLRNGIWQGINHKDLKAIYGPFSELLFRACASLWPSPLFFKIVFTLFDLGTLVFLLLLMRARAIELRHSVLYALNPLVLFSIAGEGHLEIVLVFWLVASLYFMQKNRHVPAFVCFGLCLATKVTPVYLLPFLINRKNAAKSLFIVAGLTLYLAYFSAPGEFLSVPLYFASWYRFNGFVNSIFMLFLPQLQASRASWGTFAVLLGFIFFFVPDTFRSVYYAVAAFCLCSTTLHPWYALVLTPFLVLYRSPAFIVLHLTLGASFLVRIHYIQTGVWRESWTIWLIEYVPFAAIAVWDCVRNKERYRKHFRTPEILSRLLKLRLLENKA